MLEDHAGNLWVGVDDALYIFKDGHFRRISGPGPQPLGMVYGLIEDTDGNIWAACNSKPKKLVRIRDFQIREEFSQPRVPSAWEMAAESAGRNLD